MNVENVIREKPHLSDVLRLYGKLLEYERYVESLAIPFTSDSLSYPPESMERVAEGFSALFDLPDEAVRPLAETLKTGAIDLSRLPLGEVPSFSLPYHEEELKSILFLIGRPYFRALKALNPLDDTEWGEGRCPVCNARPAMASSFIESRRYFYCSFCTTRGFFSGAGCPTCSGASSRSIETLTAESEEGFRVELCESCLSYLKSVDHSKLNGITFDLADLVSLPLDIVAQNRGFARTAPNPIGLVLTT